MKIGNHDTHEAADAYPLLTGSDLANLIDDIKANGQVMPGWLYQGQILDGRNRYIATLKLGIEMQWDEYEGDDPIGFVKSMNNDRRHQEQLSRVLSLQRIVAISTHGRRKAKQDALPGVELATSAMVKQIDQDGSHELVAAVHAGEVDAAHAAALSQLEPDEQREGIERIKAARAEEEQPEPDRAKQADDACQSVLVRLSPIEIAALRCLALLGDNSVHQEAKAGSKVLRRIVPGVGR